MQAADASRTPDRTHADPVWDIEVVADSDSRWKWGAALAPLLAPDAGARVHGTLLWGRATPNDRQLRDVGARPTTLRRATTSETVARLADTEAQVVVLACIGGGVQALLHALARAWAGRERRPVVVTGYVGMVYENVVGGLVARAGADVVLANSRADFARFRDIYDELDTDADSIVHAGLPFLDGEPHDPHAAGRDRPFTVTFVAQPGVPASKTERRYVLDQAAKHARRHPDRLVVVKLRGRVGERTTHVEPFHYAALAKRMDLPDNLRLVYGAMGPVLDRTDLCVTVSSTAAIEAMHRGIPTGILLDFGLRESLGNHAFLGCGAYTSWPELHAGALPVVDPPWALRHGVHGGADHTAAAARVAQLVARGADLPALRPWLDRTEAAAYLPEVFARHGLDAAARPLAGRGAEDTTAGGRAVRAAARRAYGVGVRVLEPRLRRMARL